MVEAGHQHAGVPWGLWSTALTVIKSWVSAGCWPAGQFRVLLRIKVDFEIEFFTTACSSLRRVQRALTRLK